MNGNFESYQQMIQARFAASALDAARAHARSEFPKESCGVIVNGRYLACQNTAEDPLQDFRISPADYRRARELGAIEAIVHSHPNGQLFPSELDMRQQIATAVPWIILPLNDSVVLQPVAFGDQLPRAPLLNRPFLWGVFDCYSLVRDYYLAHHRLELPAVPREDEWWNKGQDLYADYLAPTGFRPIDYRQARPGDGFLLKWMGSDKLTHAGVLLDDGTILHHLPTRLSRREPSGIWARGADLWVRHEAING